jgi:membrane protease YdiL (CAAX protease family)
MAEIHEIPKTQRPVAFIICFIFGGTIGLAAYFGAIPLDIRHWIRLALFAVFLIGLLISRQRIAVWEVTLAFWSVITGILLASLVGNKLTIWLAISRTDARGYAVDKFGEVVPIILLILLPVFVRKQSMKDLHLFSGRLGLSLLGGLAVSLILFGYFLSQGGWQVFQNGNLLKLLPTIGWITIFSVLNALMEELWFRGLFLSRFEWLLGKRPAFWLTALLFGLLHVFGSFTGTLGTALLTFFTFLMGLAFGFIVQRTRNIWGAVLGHFFADFFMLLGFFATNAPF